MKIAITGADGTIGKVLRERLSAEHELVPMDIKSSVEEVKNGHRIDVAEEFDRLVNLVRGSDAVVHLAWDTTENFRSEKMVPANKRMFENVYEAAVKAGVPRVVMASSIHAAGNSNEDPVPPGAVNPDSPYGATKVYMEALGRWYAVEKGLSVVVIRFGGVNPDDDVEMEGEPQYAGNWLSHGDCAGLVSRITEMEVPDEGEYHQLYGISDNRERIYSLDNDIDWSPEDDSAERMT